ncbi:hypothetical protein GCM10023317_11950 [Actinopolymorpha pittospori]
MSLFLGSRSAGYQGDPFKGYWKPSRVNASRWHPKWALICEDAGSGSQSTEATEAADIRSPGPSLASGHRGRPSYAGRCKGLVPVRGLFQRNIDDLRVRIAGELVT